MTDEELIARLRSLGLNSFNIAADRVEALIEGSKGLAEAFATVSVKREMTEAKFDKIVKMLPDDLYDSKDWRHGNTEERITWLIVMLANAKEENDLLYEMMGAIND